MSKKQLALFIILFAVIFSLMVPSFARRVYFENTNKGAILSLDYESIRESFDNKKIPELLNDAKDKGIKTVTISIEDIKKDGISGFANDFDLALFIDAKNFSAEDAPLIKKAAKGSNLKYINLKGDFEDKLQGEVIINSLSRVIKENNLILVVSETKDQSANDIPSNGYNHIKESAGGRIIRCYDTSYSANKKIDPNLRFHQMLNSLKDRNTHFINLVPFEDNSASKKDNYYAMLSSVSLFTKEASDEGYILNDFEPDFNGYSTMLELNLALGFILCILLSYIMLIILFGNVCSIIKVIFSISSIVGFAFPFVMSYASELFYPLILAVVSSCFVISLSFYAVKKYSQKGFAFCLVLTLAVSLAGFFLRGFSLSAVLSGADYYLYFKTFRGVKLSLIIPVFYSAFAYVKIFGFSKPEIKKQINARGIILIFSGVILLFAAVFIYIMRSGNSIVSGIEINIRNSLDVLMGIRPRTKEFLIGWPCLWLFVWYKTNTKQDFIPLVLSLGVAILSSSVINSFCHVFTPAMSIYNRTVKGFILSVPIAILILLVNIMVCKLLKVNNNK
ncbi:MAG: hypothetical protein IJN40_02570 [Clostridia bacterium]|nr:hypothetical protein [Clostridia bacterium]